MKIDVLSRGKKKFVEGLNDLVVNGNLEILRPDGNIGGGLTGEVCLLVYDNKKYVVRMCESEGRAKSYESISRKLSKYKILPKFIGRNDKNVFYEYLEGRDLKRDEVLKFFEQIGFVCGKINNLDGEKNGDINSNFNKQLIELVSGNYRKFTLDEMKKKRARRPNERYDKRKIRALFTQEEGKKLKKINTNLINKTGATTSLDAFDVSPANFRLSEGKVYFVDIDAIRTRVKGIGVAKCLFGWVKNRKQGQSFLKGYSSALKDDFLTEEYMDLLNLHFLVQSLHDRAKLGRDYKEQYKKLKMLLDKNED